MFDLVVKLLRSLIFFFDRLIYGFIPKVYSFIEILARVSLFDNDQLAHIANNIYAIIGIFMLFRLAFVLLKAIVDPDALTSKEGGAAKMMSKAIIALILIAAIPWGFRFAFRFQDTILNKQILLKIILGSDNSDRDAGQRIAKESLSAFLSCNETVGTQCNKSDLDSYFNMAFPETVSDGESNSSDFSGLSDHLNEQVNTSVDGNSKEVFKYKYDALISTICGGFILYLMIMFAFEVASRIVKLGFLQLISPIAVVGYIDPKSTVFNSWFKMTMKTYVNLFIRLFAIYFMTYAINVVTSLDLNNIRGYDDQVLVITDTQAGFVKIFIILGALMFAKEAPNMLSQMLNLGEGSLGGLFKNPLKSMLGGGLIGGAGAGAMKLGAGIAGGASGLASSWRRGGSKWAGLKQGAVAGAKGVPWKGTLKGLGGVATSWHKGATAGASGALGVDTKVGFSRLWEKAGQKTEAQQIKARMASQAKQAKSLYDAKKENEAKNRNPYQGLFGKADYETQAWNVDRAKDLVKRNEIARQTAYNAYALAQTEEERNACAGVYKDANDAFVNSQKTLEYHKSELERMDNMGTYTKEATNRKILEAYEAEQKAFEGIKKSETPLPNNKETSTPRSSSPQTTTPPPSDSSWSGGPHEPPMF